MTKQFVIDYIDKKLEENENYVRYTFFELKVKRDLTEEELEVFLQMNKDYFENNGYKVYFTDDKFTYENANRTVQSNELMIAIKENK